jgi:SAM-dependent methyltransferase
VAMDQSPRVATAQQLQKAYYQRTANTYQRDHVTDGDEHSVALDHILAVCAQLGVRDVLDVGCGTGRALQHLSRDQTTRLVGIEPVAELLSIARNTCLPPTSLLQGVGTSLPLRSSSVDAVCATGVMHHVPDASPVVAEMLRVARRAIFISDYNRFGAGPIAWRWTKLALAKAGAWPSIYRLRTRGRGYSISDGDGIAYSYSIYDSLTQLLSWTDRVYVIPTAPVSSATWFSPLLASTHGLLCALRPTPATMG